MVTCKRCKKEFEPAEGSDANPTFCPDCEKLIEAAQAARKLEKAEKQKAKIEKESVKEEEGKGKGGDAAELATLANTFQDGPPAMTACAQQIAETTKTVDPAVLVKALKAVQYSAARIPGANLNQLLFVFIEAFRRNSSVVLGGSRVKSYFKRQKLFREENEIQDMGEELKKASDLDIGYGNLKPGSAGFINDTANKMGPPPIEQFIIMEGQKSPTFGPLPAPEEFFHMEGERPRDDPKSKIEPKATPSGCITFAPDGTIQENGPDVPLNRLQIPASGRKPRPIGNM
jgi:hypothetical protein